MILYLQLVKLPRVKVLLNYIFLHFCNIPIYVIDHYLKMKWNQNKKFILIQYHVFQTKDFFICTLSCILQGWTKKASDSVNSFSGRVSAFFERAHDNSMCVLTGGSKHSVKLISLGLARHCRFFKSDNLVLRMCYFSSERDHGAKHTNWKFCFISVIVLFCVVTF